MDTASTNCKFSRIVANVIGILVILAIAFPVTGGASAQESNLKVGLVVSESGIYDNGFNMLAYQGLQRAVADLGVTSIVYTPADPTAYGTVLQQCADDGNGLCIAVGFGFGVSLANAAKVYTDTKWAIIDWSYPDCWEGAQEGVECGSFTEISNVRGLRFNEKQAGYLAGVLAAGMTASNVVGAVGGMEVAPVVAFVEGYRNGAQCSNSQAQVLSTYTGTFTDPNLGVSTAQDMIGQGVDVIFGAAGETGNGAILYSAQNGKWAIGVDADQYLTLFGEGAIDGSNKLLSSAIKRVDNAVYQTIQDYVNGAFSSGTVIYDLAMDGVGLAPFHETDGSIPLSLKDNLETVRQGIINGTVDIDDPCTPPPVPWRDEFDGLLADGWYWLNSPPPNWNLAENPGFLRIYNGPRDAVGRNVLLRPVSQNDFAIETRVLFEPNLNFEFAGLFIYQDDGNNLAFGRAFCDISDNCVGNGVYFDNVSGGTWTGSNFGTAVNNSNEAYLRLEKRGEMVRALFSYEGVSWYEIGTHWVSPGFQVNGVGLIGVGVAADSGEDILADYDYFELTEGWGYLPEGFHDYEQGDVPSWACTAGGWAADPDDRAARLNVEIVADDQTVASLVAGDFRQDLQDAGVCEGGNCSFSTSLWGAISSYTPLRVDAWAQDNWTGEWVLLSNSVKTLTCRTYDIYAYNPSTGTTQQITNMRDTDEYNPAWSPDGKKVAHDVHFGDRPQAIYITNVQTGVSTPLKGAQDGANDAAWSPSGSVIIFDRRWDGDPNLYRVPPSGGARKLIRQDAVSAAWSPNGKFLAFHQMSDGSIRTVFFAVPGGKARFIGYGWNPAWSPDGKWIAYQQDGDIWKVRVDLLGAALGAPVQVTHGPFFDDQPTWSRDSQSIIYHSSMTDDFDLWSIPAAGGEPTWLTGAPRFGDYGPANAKNGSKVAYASFSPDGQAARQWVAAYTYDPAPGTFTEDGTFPYHFEFEWSLPEPATFSGQGGDLVISSGAPTYPGNVLLRGIKEIRGVDTPDGLICEEVDAVNPDQPMRFLIGWLPDYGEMTYADALAHFESITTARVIWGDESSADLLRHMIMPFSLDSWPAYVCTFTAP